MHDVAIIGGGLAGLSASILLARAGHRVVVLEKGRYPFHRVCGEYISRESEPFLNALGVDVSKFAQIDRLVVSSPSGRELKADLDMGGVGVSRFLLDNELRLLAQAAGVEVLDSSNVEKVSFDGHFSVKYRGGDLLARAAVGSYGKRSRLDTELQRSFIGKKAGALNNFVGIKYHIRGNFSRDTIWLHNFDGGYCGMSAVEEDLYCLCYMTTAAKLRKWGNSIPDMERGLLFKNPALQAVFEQAEFVREQPVTISQISFERKSSVENHMLMAGDASGMIAPLCGNGMSMALHAGKLSATIIGEYLRGDITREQMEVKYLRQWHEKFSGRLFRGRVIQRLMGRRATTEWFIRSLRQAPGLTKKIISSTHGSEF